MNIAKKVTVRELQHNFSDLFELAKSKPLLVSKHGKDELLLLNPKEFKITRVKSSVSEAKDVMNLPFIGMHKAKNEWKNKSSVEIANELKLKSWYGQ